MSARAPLATTSTSARYLARTRMPSGAAARKQLCGDLASLRVFPSSESMNENSPDKAIRDDLPTEGRAESFWFALARGVVRRTLIRSHPRLYVAGTTGLLLYLLFSGSTGQTAAFLIAFDGGALTFLAAVWIMMARATHDDMQRRAKLEAEGRYTVLGFSSVAAIAVLLAIVFELHGSK